MKRTVLILVSIFFLTSCGSKLPDPNMTLPDTPPNPELMEPTSNPE